MGNAVEVLGIVGAGGGEGGNDVTALLSALLILFVAAKAGAELFERFRQPAVVGEILAGVIVGPQVLQLVRPTEVTLALSELGVIFLLFLVGLETRPADLFKVGKDAIFVALGGVLVPFFFGYTAMVLWGGEAIVALFAGTVLVATSVGITVQVLGRIGVVSSDAARIILAAAIIDDILGLLALAVVSGFARGEGVDTRQIVVTAVSALLFTGVMVAYGGRVVARARPALERLRIAHSLYIAAIGLCLLLSVTAGYLGVAAIIGAFLAGVAFAEVAEEFNLHRWFSGLVEFFVPFFLAGIGMELSLASLSRGSVLAMAVVFTLLAVVGKVFGCGLPLWRRDRRMAMQVGMGMVPRGEVGIIVARLGLGLEVFNDDIFAAMIFVAVATTMLAPPFLVRLFASQAASRVGEETSSTANAPEH
ncbi:MAG: cation:proton antiporter [Armatimonadota bacterium]|nr:cation:proton antiporter [Armatimonadota bacterium]